MEKVREFVRKVVGPNIEETKTIESAEQRNIFRDEGAFWTVIFCGERLNPVPNLLGLHYIAKLLFNPNDSFHCKSLIKLSGIIPSKKSAEYFDYEDDLTIRNAIDEVIPNVEDKEKKRLISSLIDLKNQKEIAEEFGNSARLVEINESINALAEKLNSAKRNMPESKKQDELARINVYRRIHAAYDKLEKCNPEAHLSDYLKKHIHTGLHCIYKPDPLNPIDWAK